MSHIEHLPIEVRLAICRQLCLHCRSGGAWASDDPDGRRGQAALAALSRTCRKLRIAAETVLYHSPVHIRSYYVLVRTLLARPHLRTCVRQLPDVNEGTRFELLDKRALVLLERAGQVLRLTTPHETVRPNRLLGGILFCLTTRLETLTHGVSVIGSASYHVAAWRAHLIPMTRTGLPSLRALRFFRESVSRLRDYGYGYTLSEPSVCALLEAAPNLRHLAFEGSVGIRRGPAENPFTDGDAWLYDDDAWLARPLRRLETLAFVGCDLDDDEYAQLEFRNLRRMVRLSPCLKRFKYDGTALSPVHRSGAVDSAFSSTANGGHKFHIWASRILQALEPAQSTLRYIYIDVSRTTCSIDLANFGHLITGKELAKFTRLETLKLDSSSFCRHVCPRCGYSHGNTYPAGNRTCLTAILPLSVRSMTVKISRMAVIDADADADATTGDLIYLGERTRQGGFPKLERFAVEMTEWDSDSEAWSRSVNETFTSEVWRSRRMVLAAFEGTRVEVSVQLAGKHALRELDDWKLEKD